jgi:hypothetical protein
VEATWTGNAGASTAAPARDPRRRARPDCRTRHYFAWYLLNVAELPDHVVAAQLRHTDGGTLVRELYPDAAMARERIRAAFREQAPVVALPSGPEARSKAS